MVGLLGGLVICVLGIKGHTAMKGAITHYDVFRIPIDGRPVECNTRFKFVGKYMKWGEGKKWLDV